MRGMRHAIAAIADQGNNLIVDDATMGGDGAAYQGLLAHYNVYIVGLFAPLERSLPMNLEARLHHPLR